MLRLRSVTVPALPWATARVCVHQHLCMAGTAVADGVAVALPHSLVLTSSAVAILRGFVPNARAVLGGCRAG
jgi:hypothetical protein